MNDNLKISKRGIKLITEFEGYHTKLENGNCRAYLDKLARPPVWTIGYGCTEGVYEGLEETREQNVARKMRELAKHEVNVRRWIKVPLNQNQFDALVSLSYNMGVSPTRSPSIINAVNRQDWEAAGRAFLLYKFAGGKEYWGLERRRIAERKLFETPHLAPKEVVQNSTKLTLLKRIRLFIGSLVPAGGFLEWLGYLGPVKDFATQNWHFMLLAGMVLFYILSKWIEYKHQEGYNSGNYVPSKAASQETLKASDEADTAMTKADAEVESGAQSNPQSGAPGA